MNTVGDEEVLLQAEEDTQRDKYLIFTLGREHYGLEIKHVTEIIGIQEITLVPELPDYIKGIINLRGQIIPVMDVRLRFCKPFREYNDRTCVIVVDIKGVSVGLIVDAVSEVHSIGAENVVPPPGVTKGYSNRYIKGIGKDSDEVKLILDCDKLLSDDETEYLGELPS